MFTFKLLLAKVHFPLNEVHACKLRHLLLVDVQSRGSRVLAFASGSSPCICVCVYFSSEGEGNVFCRNAHSTLSDRLVVRLAPVMHSGHLLSTLSSHSAQGGVYYGHIHLSFVCLMWHLYYVAVIFFLIFFSCVTSAPIPFFHRCAPVNISCYAKFAEALITFVSDNSVLHRLISGVMTSKEIILGLCLLSLGNCFSHY